MFCKLVYMVADNRRLDALFVEKLGEGWYLARIISEDGVARRLEKRITYDLAMKVINIMGVVR